VKNFLSFQTFLQLLVTIAQHLGAHFHFREDEVGFFSCYAANLMLMRNLFGVGGSAAVDAELGYVFGWWYDWIIGLTLLFTWRLPKYAVAKFWAVLVRAVNITGQKTAGEYRGGRVKETVHQFQTLENWLSCLSENVCDVALSLWPQQRDFRDRL
jgi:hypothetical protein